MAITEVLENHNMLKEAFDKYLNSLDQTNERRQLWNSEVKEKIFNVLTSIYNSFKFDWHVQRLESVSNYQTINISCNSHNSGMVKTFYDDNTGKPTKRKAYTKHGGYLAYCQSYNGKINVIIGFPYIDEWVTQMDAKVIATVEPSAITEDIISQHVIKFLQIMSEWEGMDRPPIGFARQ